MMNFSKLRPLPPVSLAHIAVLLGLELLALLLYADTLRHPLLFDDHAFVFGQAFLRDAGNLWKVLSPRSLFDALPVANSARPVWLASVLLDARLYGDAIWGYRLTSIFWHGCGGVLLAFLAWQLAGNLRAAALAGALFVLHPLHTEAVNLIANRSGLLSFFFMALAVYLYLRARGRPLRRRAGWIAASLASFALALLSDETAVVLPLLLLLADLLFPQKAPESAGRFSPRKSLGLYAGYAAILLLYIAFHIPRSGYVMQAREDPLGDWLEKYPPVFSKISAPGPQTPALASRKVRLLTMAKISGSYLRRLAWPHPLQGDYAPKPIDSWGDFRVWAAAIAWLLLFSAAWALRRRQPLISLGLLWIPISLLPVSGVIALANLEADRYLYIPSAGICLAAAASLAALSRLRPGRLFRFAAAMVFLAAAGSLAALTVLRNRDYTDDRHFYLATEAVDPNIPRVHANLAIAYAKMGQANKAEEQFREALRLWPGYVHARSAFANFLMDEKRSDEALRELETNLTLAPDDPAVRYDLGMAYWAAGRKAQALFYLESVENVSPDYRRARLNVGRYLLERGRAREAIGHLEGALNATRWVSDQALYDLALAYRKTGRRAEARRLQDMLKRANPALAASYARSETKKAEAEFRGALRLWPGDLRGRAAFADFPSEGKRIGEAIDALKADLASAPDDPWVRYDLGMAYWVTGRKAQALFYLEGVENVSPVYWRARLNVGQYLLEQGRAREAIGHLEGALDATQWGSNQALYDLAMAYRKAGRRAEARRIQGILKKANPALAARYARAASARPR